MVAFEGSLYNMEFVCGRISEPIYGIARLGDIGHQFDTISREKRRKKNGEDCTRNVGSRK